MSSKLQGGLVQQKELTSIQCRGDRPVLFAELVQDIERVYVELGHSMDWRFLTVPQHTFDAPPKLLLLTLNPGGRGPAPSQGKASCEYGCAYRLETWGAQAGKSALQVQILALLDHLRQRLSPLAAADDFMDHEVLGAYYLPFRSPSLAELPNRLKSLEFAQTLWARILTSWMPQLVVTIDHFAFGGIQSTFTENLSLRRDFVKPFPTGWGKCRADVARYVSSEGASTTILRLPHLSTYKLFSRDSCRQNLNEILNCACLDLTCRGNFAATR